MKSYFQIVSKYKIQRYWKMFAEKKEQIQNLYFYNWSGKWFRNALEKKACKYVVEYLDAEKTKISDEEIVHGTMSQLWSKQWYIMIAPQEQ